MAEKKSKIEIILMPLVVALVGIVGTWLITSQQQKNATKLGQIQLQSSEQRSRADRQIRILEIFAEKITSQNPQDRIIALNILEELDSELAAKLASVAAIAEEQKQDVVNVAQKVARDAAVRAQKARVFIHISRAQDRETAKFIAGKLDSEGYIVPGIELVNDGPNIAQLRYFRPEDQAVAEKINLLMEAIDVRIKPVFVDGFQDKAKPGDFEIWFGAIESLER